MLGEIVQQVELEKSGLLPPPEVESKKSNVLLAGEVLFPISDKTCPVYRRTSLMMQFDLNAARRKWVADAETESERLRRENSDFLCYRNAEGKFADFHGLRHTFISNLCRAGVSPKTAQVLARHSSMELTMNIYTHIDQATQAAAINSLPGLKR